MGRGRTLSGVLNEVVGSEAREADEVGSVHDRLRDAILWGRLAAGRTTSQVALMEEFGVGRTPLREALRQLQREGLVVSEPNRPVRIADFSSVDFESLYAMRISLEAVAIRQTVPRLRSSDLAELEGLMAQMDHYQRREDRPGLRVPHRAFHMMLVSGAGPRATRTMTQLFDHAERYRIAFGAGTPKVWEQRATEHRAILDAVADADTEAAARLLVAHYLRTAALVVDALDPARDLDNLRIAFRTVAPGAEVALDTPRATR
jgi:DNA-binding GntR family transcriptional regulator